MSSAGPFKNVRFGGVFNTTNVTYLRCGVSQSYGTFSRKTKSYALYNNLLLFSNGFFYFFKVFYLLFFELPLGRRKLSWV